jgi:hypothetical protein
MKEKKLMYFPPGFAVTFMVCIWWQMSKLHIYNNYTVKEWIIASFIWIDDELCSVGTVKE